MRSSSTVRAGITAVLVLVAACALGPLLLPELPGADPVRASLLAPGTRVTAVTLTDGTVLASPDVRLDEVGAATIGPAGETVPPDKIESVDHFRYWLGSDRFGRDVFRQLLQGGRISLGIAALSVAVAVVLGGLVGLAAASAGGVLDSLLMRLVDALLAFPVLFLMILAAALFRPSPLALVLLLGATSWMGVARLVRGQVLSLRSRPFVLAARASGSRWSRIATLHYAPNLVGPVAQDTALRMGDLVIAEATLSYLGLGVPPSIVTWGSMVAEGHRVMLDGWWLAVLPGLAIAWLVIGLAVIGDGLLERGEPAA